MQSSGGHTDRPAFQRLLADIEGGKVDAIAAYKIDRVSRSLADFTRFMDLLKRQGVALVSTTQSFDKGELPDLQEERRSGS